MAASGQQPLTPGVVRFPSAGAPRPTTIEQYEQLLQRQQQLQSRNTALEQQHQQQQAPSGPGVRIPEAPPTNVQQKTVTGIPQVSFSSIYAGIIRIAIKQYDRERQSDHISENFCAAIARYTTESNNG